MTPPSAAQVSPTSRPGSATRGERRFFTSYMLVILGAILFGFAPTFFLRGVVEPFGPLKPLRPALLAHGFVTTAWILLFPLQAWLIAAGKRALHVRLGKIGFALGLATAASAYVVAVGLYQEPVAPPLTPAINVLLPITDVAALLVLLPLAWATRIDAQTHKRLMVIIACLLSGAALFRLPVWSRGDVAGFVVIHLFLFATVLPLWLWDWRTCGRLHRATVIGSAILAIDMFGRLLIAQTAAWAAFVRMLPGFGAP
jgi:hypothetical protein